MVRATNYSHRWIPLDWRIFHIESHIQYWMLLPNRAQIFRMNNTILAMDLFFLFQKKRVNILLSIKLDEIGWNNKNIQRNWICITCTQFTCFYRFSRGEPMRSRKEFIPFMAKKINFVKINLFCSLTIQTNGSVQ